ncbi:cytochrome c biogenesis protein DipZ [Demequina sp. NBRC 110053]|uniref:cytochrome c biogenesis protein DipZ n=1 Tax=Demequina sp. NBRC 110053 TaxID=1570342 RepID=UPI0013566077|nr:cytochrome c biogenesis protein DipZ [Demequina sp. NBRC 110053]
MITLALVGVVSGLITAISPCVLPVLPAILTSSIQDGAASRRRPIVVVAGLVTSFALFTLLGGLLLSSLGLPEDLLRWVGIGVLALVGLGLAIPPLGELLQRPFERIAPPQLSRDGNGFVMGLALGLVFVPCAGPILASITVLAATNGFSWGLVALTLSFSVGIAIPLIAFGLAGQAMGSRIKAVRERLGAIRIASGVVLVATALVIATNVAEPLQRWVPGVLAQAQESIEDNDTVRDELDTLAGREDAQPASGDALTFDECADSDPARALNCGSARDIVGIQEWLNTDGQALDLEQLAADGQVVLIDFWTYSCINCQRTFPYLTAWDERYRDDGLTIIGVHSPEFAFEKVVGNVEDAASRYGIEYPIAIDNDFETWRAWDQRFWPAHYLIDTDGVVRQVHYGEGAYEETELLIQDLLDTAPQAAVEGDDPAGHTRGRTQETYLGYGRLEWAHNADQVRADAPAEYSYDGTIERDRFVYDGEWTVTDQYALAGDDARLEIYFYAADVHLVMAGQGEVTVTLANDPSFSRTIEVDGTSDLYTLLSSEPTQDVMELEFSPGIEAYAFTFG